MEPLDREDKEDHRDQREWLVMKAREDKLDCREILDLQEYRDRLVEMERQA